MGRAAPKPVAERLLAKLDRHYGQAAPADRPELGECWEWMGARNSDGYGIIRGAREPDGSYPLVLVHRVALSLALGRPLEPDMNANHRCDNRPCARPRHLYEGTHTDNLDDQYARDRRPKRRRIG